MEEHSLVHGQKSGNAIEKIAYGILGIVLFLLPFFFIPSQVVSLQMSKGLVLSTGVVLALALFIVSLIKSAQVSVPRNLLSLALIILPIVFLVSSLMNGAKENQLIGFPYDMGTVSFMFFVAVLALLVGQVFRSKERIFYSYLTFFASFGLVMLFQLSRLFFGPETLSFGIFTASVSNLLGNWNDLGVFFAVSTLLSLMTLEMLELNKMLKSLVWAVFVSSLAFLAVVNFSTGWIVLAVFSLLFFLYLISFERFAPSQELAHDMQVNNHEPRGRSFERKVSWPALVVLVVSIMFIFFGGAIGEKLSVMFKVVSIEVRPSWSATISVIKDTLATSPVVGSGPNSFTESWLLHKPSGINNTLFWNTDFAYGIGLIPSLFATTGALGILAWIFFFVVFIWVGLKAIFYQISDLFSRYLITSSFLVSLFFWIMAVVYVPSVANFVLGFFFTGLFAASLYREGLLKEKQFSLINHPKLSFISVLALIVLLIANVTFGYLVLQRSVSLVYFQNSILGLQNDSNVDSAQTAVLRAITLNKQDLYYRGLSELNLLRVDRLLNQPGATPESIRDEFQLNLANSIENARKATEINPRDYQNWVALGRVYASLVPPPFSIPGAYENAKRTFDEALKVNPHSPVIHILLARLEAAKGDLKGTREYVNKAIAEKSNYAEAHFLLAQIEVAEGKLDRAIPALETTLILSPNNPGLFFQLGLLKYNDRNWPGAIDAFSKAVQLVPEYANAKYFLGLSLQKVSRNNEAIKQFEDLEKGNPDNQEVKLILNNLREGKDPFANAKPPVDTKPEKREKLPLNEASS